LIALGAIWGSISWAAKIASMSALTLISPSASVTGNISTKTRRTAGSRQSSTSCSRPGSRRSHGSGSTNWTSVPTRIDPA
jgi:hypothetical protein